MKSCQKCGKLINDSSEYNLCTKCQEKVENTDAYKVPAVKSNRTLWAFVIALILLLFIISIAAYCANRPTKAIADIPILSDTEKSSEAVPSSEISSLADSENTAADHPAAEQTVIFDTSNSAKVGLVFNGDDLATVQCFFDGKDLEIELFRIVTIASVLSDAGYGHITFAIFSGLDFGIINYRGGEMAFDENYPKPYLSLTKSFSLQDSAVSDLRLISTSVEKLIEDYSALDKQKTDD